LTAKIWQAITRVHWKLTGCGSCSFAGSRYIYDLYYEKEAISKKLYEWLLKNNYADAMLIAKWKKQGYEKVSAVAVLFSTIARRC
jgi:hypothetical protein